MSRLHSDARRTEDMTLAVLRHAYGRLRSVRGMEGDAALLNRAIANVTGIPVDACQGFCEVVPDVPVALYLVLYQGESVATPLRYCAACAELVEIGEADAPVEWIERVPAEKRKPGFYQVSRTNGYEPVQTLRVDTWPQAIDAIGALRAARPGCHIRVITDDYDYCTETGASDGLTDDERECLVVLGVLP